MITKGIIKTIDFNGNTCTVRIPVFEGAGNQKEVVAEATFAITPGIYNGYKVDDVVVVSFEDNTYDKPVVLGKLYLGAGKEKADARGSINCDSILVKNTTSIPLSAKLVYETSNNTKADVKGSYSSYKTIADIINGLKTQEETIRKEIIDDGSSIGARLRKVEEDNTRQDSELVLHADEIAARVTKTQHDTTTGFGWTLDNDSWKLISTNTALHTEEMPIMTVDASGMTLSGTLKIQDYPTKTEHWFAQIQSDKEQDLPAFDPDAKEHPGWDNKSPERKDGWFIWEKTVTYKYTYVAPTGEETSGHLEEKGTVISTTCLTGAAGASAVAYRLNVPADVHTGIAQKTNIIVTAYKKIGNDPEQVDTTAIFYINDSATPASTGSGILTISVDDIKTTYKISDITIIAKHKYTTTVGEEEVEYDREIIEYSPNTPSVTLTEDTAQIKKDDKEQPIAVNTTAKLYLSGNDISDKATSFTWKYPDNTTSSGQKLITSQIGVHTCTVKYNGQEYIKGFKTAYLNDAINYWLVISDRVHLGKNQTTPILVNARKKIGEHPEDIDTTAIIKYKWATDETWTDYPTAGIIECRNEDLIIIGLHGNVEYEREVVTFSPKGVPVLDLSNDSEAVAYNDQGQIGTEEATSTATVFFDGSEVTEGITYAWTADGCTIKSGANSATVVIKANSYTKDTALVTCNATTKYKDADGNNIIVSKVFKITKQWQGLQGETGESVYRLDIYNEFASIPCTADGTPTYTTEEQWKNKTEHTITVFYGTEQKNFVVKKYGEVGPQDTLTLYYDYDNTALTYKPGTVSDKTYTAHISALTADVGTVSYQLRLNDKILANCKFEASKRKSGESQYKLEIDNEFVSAPSDSAGNITWTDEQWTSETQHSFSAYYGSETKTISKIYKTMPTTGEISDTLIVVIATSEIASAYINIDASNKVYLSKEALASKENGSIIYNLVKVKTLSDYQTVASAKFEITKQKAGEPATSYKIISSDSVIKKDKNGNLIPAAETGVTFNFKSQTGTEAMKDFKGWYTVYKDDETEPETKLQGTSVTYTAYSQTTEKIYCNLYWKNTDNTYTLIDKETLKVVIDGDDGVDYWLTTSVGSIKQAKDGSRDPSTGGITISFYKQVGKQDGQPTSEGYVSYTADGISSDLIQIPVTCTYTIPQEIINAITSKIEVFFWDKNTDEKVKYDYESIPLIIDGSDGTSFNIKGTVANHTELEAITTKKDGDGYIVEDASDDPDIGEKESKGVLYVYRTDTSAWIYIGKVKGSDGKDGKNGEFYYLQISAALHTGHTQKSNILFAPMISKWDNTTNKNIIEIDSTADICYYYEGDPESAWTKVVAPITEFIEIDKTAIQDKNLIIDAYHQDETKAWKIEDRYEHEIITYSPLNTPVIDLTNDSDSLNYKADKKTKENENDYVTTTARLALNGTYIASGLTYSWTTVNCTIGPSTSTTTDTIQINAIAENSDNAKATCTITYDGGTYTKDFSITKCITGNTGDKGKDAYEINKVITQYQVSVTKEALDPDKWVEDPSELPAVSEGEFIWTRTKTTFKEQGGTTLSPVYSDPIKDSAYALAQGKSTNYYADVDPWDNGTGTQIRTIKVNDCWFDNGYHSVGTFDELNKYIGYYVVADSTTTPVTYSDKLTKDNISSYSITPGTTEAFTKGTLRQCTAVDSTTGKPHWEDIGGEIVTNKITANYVNALDITAKKITVLDTTEKTNILFKADGIDEHKVQIGGFDVDHNSLGLTGKVIGDIGSVVVCSGNNDSATSIASSPEKTDWCFTADSNFGVDLTGKVYAADLMVDGIEFSTEHANNGQQFNFKAVYIETGEGTADTIKIYETSGRVLTQNLNFSVTASGKIDGVPTSINATGTMLAGTSQVIITLPTKFFPRSENPIETLEPTKWTDGTGDFKNDTGFFKDKYGKYTKGYTFSLRQGEIAGFDKTWQSYQVKWMRPTISDGNINWRQLDDEADTLFAGDICSYYIPASDFTHISSITASLQINNFCTASEDEKTIILTTPNVIISNIDYSGVVSPGYIKVSICITNFTTRYKPTKADKLFLTIYGDNNELPSTEKQYRIQFLLEMRAGSSSISGRIDPKLDTDRLVKIDNIKYYGTGADTGYGGMSAVKREQFEVDDAGVITYAYSNSNALENDIIYVCGYTYTLKEANEGE